MYYDPTKMIAFDKNNWVFVDVVYGRPYFQMYNFAQPTKINDLHKMSFYKFNKINNISPHVEVISKHLEQFVP